MYLLPFSPGDKKPDDGFGDSGATCDDGGMINKFIGAEFKEEQSGNESSNVVGNYIRVGHIFYHVPYETTVRVPVNRASKEMIGR